MSILRDPNGPDGCAQTPPWVHGDSLERSRRSHRALARREHRDAIAAFVCALKLLGEGRARDALWPLSCLQDLIAASEHHARLAGLL